MVVLTVMFNGSAASLVQLMEICRGCDVGWVASQVFEKLMLATLGFLISVQVWSVFWTAVMVLLKPWAAPTMIGTSLLCPCKSPWSKMYDCSEAPGTSDEPSARRS